MTQQWEYRTETAEVGTHYDSLTELHLTPLGRQGWELVHISEWPVSGQTKLVKAYLKRPMVEQATWG